MVDNQDSEAVGEDMYTKIERIAERERKQQAEVLRPKLKPGQVLSSDVGYTCYPVAVLTPRPDLSIAINDIIKGSGIDRVYTVYLCNTHHVSVWAKDNNAYCIEIDEEYTEDEVKGELARILTGIFADEAIMNYHKIMQPLFLNQINDKLALNKKE